MAARLSMEAVQAITSAATQNSQTLKGRSHLPETWVKQKWSRKYSLESQCFAFVFCVFQRVTMSLLACCKDKKFNNSFYPFILFRCIHASLKEALSVRRSIPIVLKSPRMGKSDQIRVNKVIYIKYMLHRGFVCPFFCLSVCQSVSWSVHWFFRLSFHRMDASLSACQTCFSHTDVIHYMVSNFIYIH